ncbi:putative N-octanoylanthranilate hydrolase AqdA1 [Methylophilaceae bacterium]|nr:putative N-octanoylanthranilate hydrolase AqdA1 [Methylophilaceae bacterium]
MSKKFWVVCTLLCSLGAPGAYAEPVKTIRNVIYGPHEKHRMDAYLPAHALKAPVILMVHGGDWRYGDKANRHVVKNKARYWVGKGFVFISVNYRLLPDADPLVQMGDVARAVAKAQKIAAYWGGDASRFILMGHSSGAHLVSLLNTSPDVALSAGARPWLGAISLDSAAMDVPALMQREHPRLYDDAFGNDPEYWQQVSPAHNLGKTASPLLSVCSLNRPDRPCNENMAFKSVAESMGLRVEVLEQAKSHGEINDDLGADAFYTRAVDAFMSSLDRGIATLLHD